MKGYAPKTCFEKEVQDNSQMAYYVFCQWKFFFILQRVVIVDTFYNMKSLFQLRSMILWQHTAETRDEAFIEG